MEHTLTMTTTGFVGILPAVWLIVLLLTVAAAVEWADVIQSERVPEPVVVSRAIMYTVS